MSKKIYMAPVAVNTGTRLRTGLLAGSGDGEILEARPTHTVTNPNNGPEGTDGAGVSKDPQNDLDHLKDW